MKKKRPATNISKQLAAQLPSLTKEEKLALLDTLDKKAALTRLRMPPYVPNAGQLPVHTSSAYVRAVFSGNGAGKTAMASNEAIWAAKGFNPITKQYTKVPARVIILLDKPEKVTDVWIPELRKWEQFDPEKQFHKRGKAHINQITFKNGSEILFMHHDQDPMTFESIEGDFFIFDEPPPRHVYVALRRAGRKKGTIPRYLLVGTPIAASWMRKEIYEPWARGEAEDTECFKFQTTVNESNLAEGYISNFAKALSDKEKRIRLEGEFFDLEGLALAHLWDRQVHIVDTLEEAGWDSSWPTVVAIDPHPNKKHVAVMLTCGPDDNYVFVKEYASKEVPREFARSLKKWYQGFRIVDIICDSLGSTAMSGGEGNKSFIEVLNEEGVRARATSWEDKKEESWIMRIQEVLAIPVAEDNFGQKLPKLRVVRGNNGIINDIESVQWVKYRNMDEYKPSLDIGNKDYLASLKYALAANLSFAKGRTRVIRKNEPVYGFQPKRLRYESFKRR